MDEVLNPDGELAFRNFGLRYLNNDAINREDDLEFLQIALFFVAMLAATDRDHKREFAEDSPLINRLGAIHQDLTEMRSGNPPKILVPAASPKKPYQTKSGSPTYSKAITVILHQVDLLQSALRISAKDARSLVRAELKKCGCDIAVGGLSDSALKVRRNRIAKDEPVGSRELHNLLAAAYDLDLAVRTGLSLLYQDHEELNFLALFNRHRQELIQNASNESAKRRFTEIVLEQIKLADGLYPSMRSDLRYSAAVLSSHESARK